MANQQTLDIDQIPILLSGADNPIFNTFTAQAQHGCIRKHVSSSTLHYRLVDYECRVPFYLISPVRANLQFARTEYQHFQCAYSEYTCHHPFGRICNSTGQSISISNALSQFGRICNSPESSISISNALFGSKTSHCSLPFRGRTEQNLPKKRCAPFLFP